MKQPIPSAEWLHVARWLPAIDWNVKLFGAHEQVVKCGWKVPEDVHVGFEIHVVLQGSQETWMEQIHYELQEGDILLVPPGFKHTIHCNDKNGLHYFCAHFNVDDPVFRQEMAIREQILFKAGTVENGRLHEIVQDWLAILRQEGSYTTGDRFRIQMVLFQLLNFLAERHPSELGEQDTLSPSSLHYAKAIAEGIKARFQAKLERRNADGNGNYTEDDGITVKIEDIATSLGITPGYCLEIFRKVYGTSPRQYLSELLLNEAKLLIQQPELSIKEIAERLGYTQLSHFSRQFKRWTGISPLQYRQMKSE